ncbi:MAG: hypothetical protein IBX55_01740 [Methyloprofundus sp.]|nr:hypothetical protein [Methyloprofundus sp.]
MLKKLQVIKEEIAENPSADHAEVVKDLILICETLQLKNQNLQVEIEHLSSEFDCAKDALGAKSDMSLGKKAKDLCAELTTMRHTFSALSVFTTKMLELPSGIIDTDQIQEIAADTGVLVKLEVNELCGEDCRCAQTGFPALCYKTVY